MRKKLLKWLTPLLAGILIFAFAKSTFAAVIDPEGVFIDFLRTNDIEVGTQTIDGYSQIFYQYKGEKTIITQGSQNSSQPASSGQYITYSKSVNGAGQIFLYHILTDTSIQLTHSSTNLSPKVDSSGKVVWERWRQGTWQIFLFDGIKLSQLTTGEASVNADIEGDKIVYGEKDVGGIWSAVVYSLAKKESKHITTRPSAKHPELSGGEIILGAKGSEKIFPLKADDFFLLGLKALTPAVSPTPTPLPPQPTAVQNVTTQEIIKELEAASLVETTQEATPAGEI